MATAAESARRHCCRRPRCRKLRGRARLSRTRRGCREVEGGAQRDAGDDAGKRDWEHEEKRDRFAAEEAGPRQRRRGKRAEDQRHESGKRRDGERKAESIEDVLASPGDGEPPQCVAGRRELVAAILAGEGIEDDEGEGDVNEGEASACGELEADGRPLRHETPAARCGMRSVRGQSAVVGLNATMMSRPYP